MQVTVVLYFRQAPPMDYQNESLLVASCHRLVRQDTVVGSCRDLPFASSTFHNDSHSQRIAVLSEGNLGGRKAGESH